MLVRREVLALEALDLQRTWINGDGRKPVAVETMSPQELENAKQFVSKTLCEIDEQVRKVCKEIAEKPQNLPDFIEELKGLSMRQENGTDSFGRLATELVRRDSVANARTNAREMSRQKPETDDVF